jgi:flagellar biogenesis protein FliO
MNIRSRVSRLLIGTTPQTITNPAINHKTPTKNNTKQKHKTKNKSNKIKSFHNIVSAIIDSDFKTLAIKLVFSSEFLVGLY